jgi:hypothetical protein
LEYDGSIHSWTLDPFTAHQDLSRRRREKSGNHAQDRRLSAAAWAEQTQKLS